MDLAGYLEITDPVNGTQVVVDNYMTHLLSSGDRGSRWQLADECTDCVCPTATCGVTTIEDAPWYDPNQAGSTEFFGLYGALRLAAPPAATIVSGIGTTTIAPLKRLTFVGILAAKSARGAAFGLDWLNRQLDPTCGACETVSAGIRLWCDEPTCDDGFTALPSGPVTVVDLCSKCVGSCDCPAPLAATPDPLPVEDNGYRQALDVTYVPGSLTEVDDIAAPLPVCHGIRVTFQYQVNSSFLFGPVAGTCTMNAPADGECGPCCDELTWTLDETVTACGCPTDCACSISVAAATDQEAVGFLPDGAAECRYSTPLCSQTYTCLTVPVSADVVIPTIRVTAGDADLVDVSITIWKAAAGLEDPFSEIGLEQYEQIPPMADPALIHRIPAGSTLTLDGRNETEVLTCPGQDPTSYPVERCGGRRYRHPQLQCGERYWIAFETHCEQTGAWSVTTEVRGI